ncbi:MAG: hypothetical protein AVDCRST_MAG55-2014, partial [uncultured Rubrobacteraceae bacterium]
VREEVPRRPDPEGVRRVGDGSRAGLGHLRRDQPLWGQHPARPRAGVHDGGTLL